MKMRILIFILICLKLVVTQIDLSATPSDSGNLRHPLSPGPLPPATPTPATGNITTTTLESNMTLPIGIIIPSIPTNVTTNVTTRNETITVLNTTTPVVPISPVTPVAPISPVTPVAPIAPVAPVVPIAPIVLPINFTETNVTVRGPQPITPSFLPIIPSITPNITNITTTTTTTTTQPINITATLYSFIPEIFFIDDKGERSNLNTRNYVALKTYNNILISCNVLGNLTTTAGPLNPDNLFIPILQNNTYIQFRSFNGGYIGYSDQLFNCMNKIPTEQNSFIVQKLGNLGIFNFTLPAGVTLENSIAIKNQNGYIGVVDGNITYVSNLNESAAFIPY